MNKTLSYNASTILSWISTSLYIPNIAMIDYQLTNYYTKTQSDARYL